jgi:hypothetical protein
VVALGQTIFIPQQGVVAVQVMQVVVQVLQVVMAQVVVGVDQLHSYQVLLYWPQLLAEQGEQDLLVVVVALVALVVDLMLFQREDLRLQDQMVQQHQV